MEGRGSALAFSSPGSRLPFHLDLANSSSTRRHAQVAAFLCKPSKCRVLSLSPRTGRLLLPAAVAAEAAEVAVEELPPSATSRKVDKSGRFCSPRAARELALLIAYGACLEGSDPVRLFDKRVNARRFPGYDFDKSALLEYDHMSFGGAPVNVGTEEEAEELMLKNERESALEYSRLEN